MNKFKSFFVLVALLCLGTMLRAQDPTSLTSAISGTTMDITNTGIDLYDDGGSDGDYSAQQDNHLIITANCTGNNVLRLHLESADLALGDTLFIYDGNSISAPILGFHTNNHSILGEYFYPSALNTTNSLTVRFKTAFRSPGAPGFGIVGECAIPCVSVAPEFFPNFYKARNGVIYDTTKLIETKYQKDTVWDIVIHDTGDTTWNDTVGFDIVQTPFIGLDICLGDSIIIHGKGIYGTGIYTPSDRSSIFHWNFGDGDTLVWGGAIYGGHKFRDIGCYDVTLRIEDERGCFSSSQAEARVRVAQMPIKTIYDLATICNSDSLLVNVGYEGEGATLTMRQIEFAKTASKSYPVRTFVPDGPNCPIRCFAAPVTFNEFPAGSMVSSKDDICSICLEYEHEFMGDYRLCVVCPSLDTAVIKYGNPSYDKAAPRNYQYGGGQFTGYPYGGNNHHTYDGSGQGTCDSLFNWYGDGIEYCWSRNNQYTLVTGESAGVTDFIGPNGDLTNYTLDRHINSQNNQYTISVVDYQFSAIQAPFNNAGTTANPNSFTTKKGSDHANQRDYYTPDSDFSDLVGCPLNGEWQYVVCDYWPSDNGWIFSWSMDICGISAGSGCEYQVAIDSVIWTPDSNYGDNLLGHWRGATLWPRDSISTYIASPDTAGTFPIHVTIYDEFGCIWDTLTRITTVWQPMPNINNGEDINLCSVESVQLSATDRNTAKSNQTFMWEPFGDSTGVIDTRTGLNTSTLYMVEVTNTQSDIRCRARDSVRVNIYQSPVPNFDPGIYPLEGCEPFTITFNNTSLYGDKFRWEFGDGDISDKENPTHTYATGRYGFKYYITTEHGCKDSLIYDDLITVFPSPVAKFSWEPINPTVLHPEVQFNNMTQPQNDDVKFYWEIQYDKNNPLSYHTLRDVNPSFDWKTSGEDISGTYIARLIAKTDQRGPSGHILECRDTVENAILLVNDFLQFPNVITANGDGINDKFIIKNLVTGMGYPYNSLAIYNRWGKRVFFKENITSEDDFWDPAADNIPAGTYYWRFSGKGYLGDIERNGTVEVLY